jgi:uncharacterized protein
MLGALLLAGAFWAALPRPALAQTDAPTLPRKAALGAQLSELQIGVRVDAVVPNLTAQALGLQVGDVINRLNDTTVRTPAEVAAWLSTQLEGAPVRVVGERNRKPLRASGTLAGRPREVSADYQVSYGQVKSERGWLRTIVTAPNGGAAQKHPALMFVQGIGPGTVDFALTADNGYAKVIQPFARSGYVTMRVDKPGVGDSEGGPFAAVDFQQTLDGYRQALKALLARPDVDPERVFLFGHSMGGYWGPLLAREFKLKGIMVSGTAFRTWIEYDLENTRRQGTLGGTTPLDMHNLLQDKALLNSAWLLEGLDLNQITARYPRLKQLVAQSFVQTPSGPQYSGQHMRFWQQVAALNMPEVWAGASGHVLALYGASDFLTDARDHELLVSWVNFMRPDSARFVQLANSDHAFLDTATQRDSLMQWGRPGGKVNTNILPVLNEWVTPLSGVPLKL